jgi:hypothetical protein
MTYAKDLEKWFCNLPRDEEGFLVEGLEKSGWEKVLDEKAVSFTKECPQSCDSTLEVTFTDGSKARYANPFQKVYPSYFSTAQFE